MTTHNTGNPLGSADARDLYDNAENLDTALNTQAMRWTDRLGVSRPTWASMAGYVDLGDYDVGIVINLRNEVVRQDGEYWKVAAATELPYTTTGSWSTDAEDFVSVGDAVLRQDLADDTGAELVGFLDDDSGSAPTTVAAAIRALTVTAAMEVTVGAGGDYATLNEVLEAVSRGRAVYVLGGFTVNVRQLAGFVMQEQIHLLNGVDLSFVTLISDDAEVVIDRASLDVDVGDYNDGLFGLDGSPQLPQNTRIAFMAYGGSKLPRIGCLYAMNATGSTTVNTIGVYCHGAGSAGSALWGCGIKDVVKPGTGRDGRALNVTHTATFNGWGSTWSGSHIGVRISNGGTANVRECDASACVIGFDGNGCGTIVGQNSNLANCEQNAIYALGGATVKVSECDMTGCAAAGTPSETYATIRAIGMCNIDASYSDISGGQRGIETREGATVDFEYGICGYRSVGAYAGAVVLTYRNEVVSYGGNYYKITDSSDLPYTMDGTWATDEPYLTSMGASLPAAMAGKALGAQWGGKIDASYASITGVASEGAVIAGPGGVITMVRGEVIDNPLVSGLYAYGGDIHAYQAIVTGNKLTGSDRDMRVRDGGKIHAYEAETTNGGASTVAVADTNVTRFNDRTEIGVVLTDQASILNGSATWNPADLASGSGETTTVTVTGAAAGDFVEASFDQPLQGLVLWGWVSASDTVSVRLHNQTGGNVNLTSGTVRVRVRKA